jgi:hypothetical protein
MLWPEGVIRVVPTAPEAKANPAVRRAKENIE